MQMGENVLSMAFQQHHTVYLRNIHLFLSKVYYDILYGEDDLLISDYLKLTRFKKMETEWINHEKAQCLNHYNCDQEVCSIHVVKQAIKQHPVFNHLLFSYLGDEASTEHMRQFLLGEAVLNVEFFDYLVLAVIGASDEAKAEIVTNIWDEAGRSDIRKFHTNLFKRLLFDMGLQYNRDECIATMSWEGLAGINLFSYLAIYSFNKMKFFGLLAATELLDPPHYHQLNKGLIRLFPKKNVNRIYYVEHETLDVEHADGWLNRVILPELARRPHKTRDFWLGFYLRLNSVKKYYDQLLTTFMVKQAA